MLLICLLLYLAKETVQQVYHHMFDDRTEIGHVMLSDLAKTEKMTVLSLYKEVIVSQYREEQGLLYGTKLNHIHSVFPGRIDIGFDLTKCSEDWMLMREDTAYVKLPAVEILNQGGWYIDETARQTPIEEGQWNNEDYVRLAHRANALVRRNSELDDCYRMAEDNGKRVVRNLLQIQPRESYKPFTLDYDGTDRKGEHYDFYVNAKGNRYVKFDNGGVLSYQGDIDDGDLYSVIDMYSYFTQSRASKQWNINKQGNHLSINMVNPSLTLGTAAAEAFVRGRRTADVERLSAALRQLFGDDLKLTITEVDRRGDKFFQY